MSRDRAMRGTKMAITEESITQADLLSRFQIMNVSSEVMPKDIQFNQKLRPTVGTTDLSVHLPDRDRAFLAQKKAFGAISEERLRQYQGRYVASLNGEIVDSDTDLVALTRRFFEVNGEVAVYITK